MHDRDPLRDLEAGAEALQHRAPRERPVLVAEERPVGQLGRRGPPGPEGDVPPARAAAGELVQDRGAGRLRRGPAAELGDGPVAQPVEDHQDRRDAVVLGHSTTPRARRRASIARRGATVAGGTSRSQSPPARIAARISVEVRRSPGPGSASTTR